MFIVCWRFPFFCFYPLFSVRVRPSLSRRRRPLHPSSSPPPHHHPTPHAHNPTNDPSTNPFSNPPNQPHPYPLPAAAWPAATVAASCSEISTKRSESKKSLGACADALPTGFWGARRRLCFLFLFGFVCGCVGVKWMEGLVGRFFHSLNTPTRTIAPSTNQPTTQPTTPSHAPRAQWHPA